jgi:hypothetical protein
MRQSDPGGGIHPDARIVGPTMPDGLAHPPRRGLENLRWIAERRVEETSNAAHLSKCSPTEFLEITRTPGSQSTTLGFQCHRDTHVGIH